VLDAGLIRDKPAYARSLDHAMPAGTYMGSVINGLYHVDNGHEAYYRGELSLHGWPIYFFDLTLHKMPIGLLLLLILACVSVRFRRPRWDEWCLIIPLIVFGFFTIRSGINIGIRHWLAVYILACVWSTRVFSMGRIWRVAGCVLLLFAAIDGLRWHPNYIAYFNRPIDRPWLRFNDSNVDWGQAIKQVRDFIDHDERAKDKRIYLSYMGRGVLANVEYYLGDRVDRFDHNRWLPRHGLLIISPPYVVGLNRPGPRFTALKTLRPIAVIGDSMLVFDLSHRDPNIPDVVPRPRKRK
jgi:hypothetical protein